jgi:hypothetical protein
MTFASGGTFLLNRRGDSRLQANLRVIPEAIELGDTKVIREQRFSFGQVRQVLGRRA